MFYGGYSIQFSFAYIPDRINNLRVGRINFDICYIRYYELYVCVVRYFKETVSKIKLFTDIFMRMQRVAHYLFLAFKLILVYFQHTFHYLINEAEYHTNLVLLIICLINNTL